MQAIILAAGMGKRLKELTKDSTKCMIQVNGITLIERMLNSLDSLNLSKIVIVVGYASDKLIEFIKTLDVKTQIVYVKNEVYNKTNNIYSLYLAREYLLKEDTLLLESDLIFEKEVLDRIIKNPFPNLALVAKYENWMDGSVVTLNEENNITGLLNKNKFKFSDIKSYYKTVNIYKFSKEFSKERYLPFLEAYCKALGNNEYYEQVLKVIIMLDETCIKADILEEELWYEIDDIQDLDIAESIFANTNTEIYEKIKSRYGGYWRYPQIIDFCYLVNPYYPPQNLIDELKSNFENLLCQYPSGLNINCLLAAKYFGVKREHIMVGNGAAELIKLLTDSLSGTLGIIRPTFEEYPNKYKNKQEVFYPNNDDFAYTAKDITDYFTDKQIESLVLINPDNPSGNYINKADMLSLIKHFGKKGVSVIADESFVDFATEENATLIDSNILESNPNLIVIKSISKSFGVPGLRLGVVATANRALLEKLKADAPIWNINSFGEFYLQIFEKYQKEYDSAILRFKERRAEFLQRLKEIKGLRVIPTQANYVMCEVLGEVSSLQLAEELLCKHNILIKDLADKKGFNKSYIRLAIKTKPEEDKLIFALKSLLNK